MPAPNSCRAGVALVIGVGEYLRAERVEALRFAACDAVALADTLADPHLCAFPSDQVLLLTNGEARRDELVQRLSRWLPERARATEVAVIYFAGHGMVQTIGRREEGFLLPYDADPDDLVTRGIAMSDLARWIDGLDARAVVVCLDCCHAGKVLGPRDAATSRAGRNMALSPALLQTMSGQGRYLIASCDEGQRSFECAELGHGLFTYHLLQGLAGAADSDGDGRVGLAELFNYVSAAVSRDARAKFGCEQKPWTSATWADETYISTPSVRRTASGAAALDPLESIYRTAGVAAALRHIEQTFAEADEAERRRALRFLGRVKEPAGIPTIFRGLSQASEAVRSEARGALHAFSWDTVVRAVEESARRGDPATVGAILDGLNAFEAHSQVVALLDRLVDLLWGELRNRTILLLERKRLGLSLDGIAALFREIYSPYQIQKVLGQGLFTASYLARDEGNGLEVVVRVLRPEFASQPQVRAAFLDLSKRSLPLVHEKLALTREARAFPDRNVYFTVRDYIPGVTLQRVLEAGRRFDPLQVIRLLRDMAEALRPLHCTGACHGGVKPSNVFLCEGDRVVLGDPTPQVQGIGLALDRLAYDYRYAAPEMFLGGGVPGPRSDFYALGCVVYELLCGAPPFVSDNFHELAARHLNDPIIPPSQRGSPLGARGDAIVLKLLARSPGERYGTLEQILGALALAAPDGRGSLLRDASLVNYQGGQSVLSFGQTGRPPTSQPLGTVPSGPAAGEPAVLQIPGYKIIRALGQGGMGTVFLAQHLPLQRVVALKFFRGSWEASAEVLARFRREAVALARLQHPGIVQIYELLEHQGLMCLALEYVGGGDLRQRMHAGGGPGGLMTTRDAAALMATLARAVDFAHQRGVLHRDLKPSNILLTDDGQPKIGDWGLARLLHDSPDAAVLTQPGSVLGTPAYMAPEQAEGQPDLLGPATDVYALGNILYELLTGRLPFAGSSMRDVLMQVQAVEPTPPRRLRPTIPPDLELVCLKCLQKDPARRYATAAALAEDLERWLRGEPIGIRPVSAWRRLARFFSFRKAARSSCATVQPAEQRARAAESLPSPRDGCCLSEARQSSTPAPQRAPSAGDLPAAQAPDA
jgi:serine/threonine protein kinase